MAQRVKVRVIKKPYRRHSVGGTFFCSEKDAKLLERLGYVKILRARKVKPPTEEPSDRYQRRDLRPEE